MRWPFVQQADRPNYGWTEGPLSNQTAKETSWFGAKSRSTQAPTLSSSRTTSAMRPAASSGSGSLPGGASRSFRRRCYLLRRARASILNSLLKFSATPSLNLSISPRTRRRDGADLSDDLSPADDERNLEELAAVRGRPARHIRAEALALEVLGTKRRLWICRFPMMP